MADLDLAVERDERGKRTGQVRLVLTTREGTEIALRLSAGRASLLADALAHASGQELCGETQQAANLRCAPRKYDGVWAEKAWALYAQPGASLTEVGIALECSPHTVRQHLIRHYGNRYANLAREKRGPRPA